MRTKLLSATIGLAVLTACNTNIAIQAPPRSPVEKAAKPKAAAPAEAASPSAAPSALPSAPAAPASIAPSAQPSVAVNPFGVPTTVRLPMPASVIATGGGNLIGQAGGNLIGQAGGNLIGQAGGNYHLLQAPPRPRLSVSIPFNMSVYMSTTALADALLTIIKSHKLAPGAPLTLTMNDGQSFTYLLELKADHAVMSIGKGKEARGAGQLMGISFSSAKKGRMVFKDPGALLGADVTLATEFDLEKGTATADAYAIGLDRSQSDSHWEFRAFPDAADGKSFVIRSATAQSDTKNVNAFTAHFMKDGSAAGATALADELTEGKLMLMPNDGMLGAQDAAKPYDLYLGTDGKDLEASAASAELKALVPTLDDFVDPLPAIPTPETDLRNDPRYAFPE